MKYQHIVQGEFIDRPNRFIAHVALDGMKERVHVKNTGRCKELLLPGTKVYLEKSDNPERSTVYDLVAVEKNGQIINIDSQATNKVVEEWLWTKAFFPNLVCVRPETTYGNSRFDFYVETPEEKIFIEVKGVTLERDGVVLFPDAPSERAVKHVLELTEAKKAGYRTMILFVIQMKGVKYFTPNKEMQRDFAEALCNAEKQGVELYAYDCNVTQDSLAIRQQVQVKLPKIPGDLRELALPLLNWYDANRRILPWREIPTPYRVWVSEIMLQQTRVEAVKPYFERFMAELPDIASLAAAEEEKLLKLWEGLGYYNRVRNLQKAAIQVMEDYGGIMPSKYEELLKLKGIGSYTAGAISSIAYGRVRPAVDGNVLRVLSRIRADKRPITDSKVKTAVEQELTEFMPLERPGDFNQAMMEIGACVCVPNGVPHCDACPLNFFCKSHIDGEELAYPVKQDKTSRTVEKKTILVIQDEGKAVIRKRADKGLLAGMYEFPWLSGYRTAEDVVEYLEKNGIKTLKITKLKDAKHIFSHREWHMQGYLVKVDELEEKGVGEDSAHWLYIFPEETKERYPIPTAYAAYTKYLKIRQGKDRFTDEET
ncbi:MAG: A/G-specific adenine glycosylase [Acetatifactor sp.]|nr:A/G-specific adenine glycosylase [Acetatifactor sp.]